MQHFSSAHAFSDGLDMEKLSDDLYSIMEIALLGKRDWGWPLKTFESCVQDEIDLSNLKYYDSLNR